MTFGRAVLGAVALLLLMPCAARYAQDEPIVVIPPPVAQFLSFVHEESRYEWAACLELRVRGDTVFVDDIRAGFVTAYSSINVGYECMPSKPLGIWHNHVANALPGSGHGCFFSDEDVAAQDSADVILAMVSCGFRGEPKIAYRINSRWREIAKDTL